MICAVYGALMLLAAVAELRNSPLNAFVLFTISATFFKGEVVKRRSYRYIASILATVFGVLMLLRTFAIGSFSYGIFALLAAPLLLKK